MCRASSSLQNTPPGATNTSHGPTPAPRGKPALHADSERCGALPRRQVDRTELVLMRPRVSSTEAQSDPAPDGRPLETGEVVWLLDFCRGGWHPMDGQIV